MLDIDYFVKAQTEIQKIAEKYFKEERNRIRQQFKKAMAVELLNIDGKRNEIEQKAVVLFHKRIIEHIKDEK